MSLTDLKFAEIGVAGELRAVWRTEFGRKIRMLAVPILALIVLVSVVDAIQPLFISLRAVTAFASESSPMLMLVMGESLVILLGGIDLSIAMMASFAAVLMVIVGPSVGDFGIPLVLAVAGAIGALQGFIHCRAQIPSFVTSFGTSGILYGLTHYISNATAAPLSEPSAIIDFMGGRTFGTPNSIVIVGICAAILAILFRVTRMGRHIYAIGASERAAKMAGVRTERVKLIVFAISSICAAIGGLLLLSQTLYSSPAMANNYILPAIVGVVVGGTAISGGVGGIACALVGGLIAAVVRVGTVVVGLNPAFQDIVFGVVVLAAVALTIDRGKLGTIK